MDTTQLENGPVLIVGGRGKTGGRVADRLADIGVPVRLGSRSSPVRFDWSDRATWVDAMVGVRSVYLTYFPDLATPGAADDVRAFAKLAGEAGIAKLVLLSGRGEPKAQDAEAALMEARPQSTIIRSSWFAQNFSESLLAPGIQSGHVYFAAEAVREPFIDADDIADVAVAALTREGHAGKIYELTGPRLMTFADAVEEIASALGRRVDYTPLPIDIYLGELSAAGVPGDLLDPLEMLLREVLDGRNEHLTDGVRDVLGRSPRDFTDFARTAAVQGMWGDGGATTS